MTQITAEKKRFGLSEQVMFGLVLGIATGLFLGEMAGPLETIGIIFIRLLQVTVIPYISVSLITGIGGLRLEEVKRLAIKGGAVLLFIGSMMLLVLICLPMAYPLWPSASFYSSSLIEVTGSIDFLSLFIPSNPILAYANSSVPAVVIFCILVGLALINITGKSKVVDPLSVFQNVMMKITGFISKLSPIGVFALVASTTGKADLADLARIQVYIVLYIMVSLSFALVILPGLIAVMTPFKYKKILSALRAPMVTAFATGSSLIVVPLLIEQCKKLIVDAGLSSMVEEDSDTTLEVLIPTVYSFPSSAAILSLSFILFSGWYIGSDIPISSYPILFLTGIPSLFGGTTITIPFLLNLMGIPVDFFKIFVSVDVITARFGTFLSAMHYAAVGLIATISIFKKLHVKWGELIKLICLSCGLILAIMLGTKAFYTHILVAPYTKDKALQAIDLLGPSQPYKVFSEIPSELLDNSAKPASPSQIEDRGVLRVCFKPDEYPSSFYSFGDTSKLIGFDIEMAHQFARQMGLPIELIPIQTEAEASVLLNKGSCDLYMRSIGISYSKTKEFNMSDAVYKSSLGLIVKDSEQQKFKHWKQIQSLGKAFRVAVEATPTNRRIIHDIFPDATIVPFTSLSEFKQFFESGGEGIDAIADMAEEGAAWTLLYPEFSLVVPKPAVFFLVGYAAAKGNDDLIRAFNAWLLSFKAYGGVDKLYSHWMLGKGMVANKPPRWSIIRNVLGWVD